MVRQRKRSMYIVLIALVLLISIGFALLSANLAINGTSRIDNVSWDVHFENVQATSNSTVVPTTLPSAPAASKLQTISYDVTFNAPGQVYEFTVDVVNGGSIDAMIESFVSKFKIDNGEEQVIANDKSNLPVFLDYYLSYSDDSTIENNHLLAAGDSETIKVRLVFKQDITSEQLNDAVGKIISLNIGLNYKQTDGTEKEVNDKKTDVYVVTNKVMRIGSKISSDINLRSNEIYAMADWNDVSGTANDYRPMFLKHTLNRYRVIEDSYVGFVVTSAIAAANEGMVLGTYYLKAGAGEYENNVETLRYAFGCSNNAENRCYYSYFEPVPSQSSFEARVFANGKILVVTAYVSGRVDVNDGSKYCIVSDSGVSECQ